MPSKKQVTISSVGTSYVESSITGLPDKFFVTSVKAEIKSGSGATVGLRLSDRSSPTVPEDIIEEFSLAGEIDEDTNLLVYTKKRKDTDLGTLYVAAKVNTGSNSVVVVNIEYDLEVVSSSGGGGGDIPGVFSTTEDGLVPAPGSVGGDFLKDDGTWATPSGSVGPDLTAIEALGGAGFPARISSGSWAIRSILGTSNRITVSDGDGTAGDPTIDISSSYVGQATITTLGTVGTGTWNATTIGISKGGTGQTTATTAFDALSPTTTLGDLIYRGASNNVRLAGNTTTTRNFLRQTGTGAGSAAPAWDTLVSGDIPATLDSNARVQVKQANVPVGTRRAINFIEGTGIAITTTDQAGGERVDVEIESTVTGVADADYGDIVVSGSGTVWTIDNDAVTYAKMQNISATQRVLARNSGGAGNTEEVTATQILDWLGATQGQILYRNGTVWTVLAVGSAGEVLTTNGAGADPSWEPASGGITHQQVMSRVAIGF